MNRRPFYTQALFVVLGLLFCLSTSYGQDREVPVAVSSTFQQMFPKVSHLQWEMEDNNWEAEFKVKGSEYSANFDTNGKWLETEVAIAISDLPQPVSGTLKDRFPACKTKEVEKVSTPKGTSFEVVLTCKDGQSEILLDSTGTVLLEERIKAKDNEKETD
ncbi:PepSY-like domain-containing protein [Limibacter armeniacum]|uniref:PepSY-like domain-containing protein n=1 Tax=Limibacter armeniacum TaxID=466084 RepID=UPI002FE57E47